MPDKVTSLSEVIRTHVPDGSAVVMCTGMEQNIPFAAGHEIIRQKKRDLTLIGPISDILFDQLIGAGVAKKVMAAWVGNVISGSAYNFRRAVEEKIPYPIEVVDYSNFTVTLALHAGALGVPFLPTFSTLGSDVQKNNPHLKEFIEPFGQEKMIAVQALEPEVAIIHVQRADPEGNCHLWGGLGITLDAARASKKVIVTAEEIVAPEVIASDPNRTLIPGFLVTAVAEVPFGAHPSPVQGYYNRDHQTYVDYHEQTKSRTGFKKWLDKWAFGIQDQKDYCNKLGDVRLKSLEVKTHAYAAAVDYGY